MQFSGAIPANLLPFGADLEVDESAYRRHLGWLADVEGVEAILVNGHAAEVTSLTREERQQCVRIAADAVGARVDVLSGIQADGTLEAQRHAADAERSGARGLLVLPPTPFILGVNHRPALVVEHLRLIAEATSLPLIVFQYPVAEGWGYTTETLARILDLEQVKGIKEWSLDIVHLQRTLDLIRARRPDVALLSSHSAALYPSLALGCDGLLSGMGSVVADWQAAMFQAVRDGKHDEARLIGQRHSALASAFYAPPFLDAHNRMKEALTLLGRLDEAWVRPPLLPLESHEREKLRKTLQAVGLLE